MADKLAGGVKAGSTSYTTDIVLRSSVDGTEVTGKVAADMTASYWRPGGTRTAITLSDLAAVNSAFTSGGVKEVDGTNMRGTYRLDVPDAALATGADWVELNVFVTGAYVYKERIALETKGAAENNALLVAVKTVTDALVSPATIATAVWASGTRTLSTYGTLVADIATAVWTAGSRTLTSFGALIAGIVSAVLDEPRAGHLAGGTVGEAINAAGSAADPLLNPVPGAYAAGTAGAALGTVGNTSLIPAIKTVTDQFTFPTAGHVAASVTFDATAFTTPLTESYAADGVAPTLAQLLFQLLSLMGETQLVLSTPPQLICKKLNGTDTAMVFELDQYPTPTRITRIS